MSAYEIQAQGFLNSLDPQQRELIRLAIVDPAGDENLKRAVLDTYQRYHESVNAAGNLNLPTNTGGNQLPEALPRHTGNNAGQVNTGPNHTGNNGNLVNVEENHTGNHVGQIDTGSNHTGNVDKIPETPHYMESKAYDSRLPIPEITKARNGFEIKSNTKHTPGAQGFRPNAGVEPRNSLELFENSIPTKDPKIRLSIDSRGDIHRFFSESKDGSGAFHWSGSSGDKNNALGNRELKNFNQEIKGLRGKK